MSETLDHLLRPIFQQDGPTLGQPPSHASQHVCFLIGIFVVSIPTFGQTFVILILGQVDARVIQEIITSLPQNRSAVSQQPPPGQLVVRWIRRGYISVVTSC
jgi:hypothetical protein